MKKKMLSLLLVLFLSMGILPIDFPMTEVQAAATMYRYCDKEYCTSSNSNLPGWTLTGTNTYYGDYGGWSAWSTSRPASSDTVYVQTATVYGYYYFRCAYCGAHMHVSTGCYSWANGCGRIPTSSSWVSMWSDRSWDSAGFYEFHGTGRYATDSLGGGRWFKWTDNGTPRTGYRYKTRSKTITYNYERWGDWSEWSTTPQYNSSTRQVDTCSAHIWGAWTTTQYPTTSSNGIKARTCSRCGCYDTASIPMRPLKKITADKLSLSNKSNGIKISWEKDNGAAGYYIYRKTKDSSYKKIKTITNGSTVSYLDKSISDNNGITYYYYVKAYAGTNKGAAEAKKTVRLIRKSIKKFTNNQSKRALMEWSSTKNITGYEIQASKSKKFTNAKINKVNKSQKAVIFSNLKVGATYYARIRTYKTIDGKKYYSAWSPVKSVYINY